MNPYLANLEDGLVLGDLIAACNRDRMFTLERFEGHKAQLSIQVFDIEKREYVVTNYGKKTYKQVIDILLDILGDYHYAKRTGDGN